MSAHMTTPCADCPYRVDAPRRLWHRAEFEGVLAAEVAPLGKIFHCHHQAVLPKAERGYCAGWLLDQVARGLPSIALRLELVNDADAAAAVDAVSGAGLDLFPSVDAMCRANGLSVRAIARLRARPCMQCGRRLTSRERVRAEHYGPYCGRCRRARRSGRARPGLRRPGAIE